MPVRGAREFSDGESTFWQVLIDCQQAKDHVVELIFTPGPRQLGATEALVLALRMNSREAGLSLSSLSGEDLKLLLEGHSETRCAVCWIQDTDHAGWAVFLLYKQLPDSEQMIVSEPLPICPRDIAGFLAVLDLDLNWSRTRLHAAYEFAKAQGDRELILGFEHLGEYFVFQTDSEGRRQAVWCFESLDSMLHELDDATKKFVTARPHTRLIRRAPLVELSPDYAEPEKPQLSIGVSAGFEDGDQ